jgi:dihydroneopterin aldolase
VPQIMEKKQTIGLEGMEFFAFHGFYEEEQKIGTKYIVDVYITIYTNTTTEDNIEKTINYEMIYEIVKNEMSNRVKLIEHLGEKIIAQLKERIVVKNKIKITIKKLHPPIAGKINNAIVCIEM